MRLTLKSSISSLILTSAILFSSGSIWFSLQSKPTVSHTTPNMPDAFIENVTATVFGKNGSPTLKIKAPRMIHYPSNDTTDITKPYVTLYRQASGPWYINSDHATATQGAIKITFFNNVIIHHPSDKANPTTTMNTASLTVFPNKQTAETIDAVTITQPDTIVHAIGMLANLSDGTIKLLSNAKGDYVPTS